MRELTKPLIVGLFLPLIVLPPIHAQRTTSAHVGSNASTANGAPENTAPAGQVPDDVMKKLSDLVHAGKYAEAQQSVTALLILYPDDQRLIKVKTLLDKAPLSSKLADPTTSSNPGASNVASSIPTLNTNAEHFTGMDKVDYNSLIELVKQAQQTTDLDQQKESLQKFMTKSGPFLVKHPDEILLWQLRAASALILNNPKAGYEAGQNLLAVGAADSIDPSMQHLMAQLNLEGWLEKRNVEITEGITNYSWMLGTWGIWGKYGYEWNEEFSISGSVIEGYPIYVGGAGKTANPDIRGTIVDSAEIRWERYFTPPKPGKTSRYPIGWQPVISYEIDKHNGTMMMVIPGESPSPTSKDTSKRTLTLSLKRISGTN